MLNSDIQPGVRKDMLGVGKIKKKSIWKELNHLINRSELR
jgi:hypothetical protein